MRDNEHRPLPRDEPAERAAIGCLLYGADSDDPDLPSLFWDESRRAIVCAAILLRSEGGQLWPQQRSEHPHEFLSVGHARAQQVATAMIQAGTWPMSLEQLEWELRQCLDAVTRTDFLHEYLDRLRLADARRRAVATAEKLSEAAFDQMADIVAVSAELGLSSTSPLEPRRRRARLLKLESVVATPIRWLWQGRIARGKLSIIAGQPGLGKSLLTVDLAARVSRGWSYPDGCASNGAANVILLSAEDDPSDTIRPRLEAANADLRRIDILRSARCFDPETGAPKERAISLGDLETIRDALLQRPECQLLVIDPISAFLEGIDSHRNSDVRSMLAPLSQLAADHQVAIVAVSHLSKGGGDTARSAVERVSGSLAFAAAARAVLIVGRDDDAEQRRLVAIAKNNLGSDAMGLAYSISPNQNGVPALRWETEPVKISADELLSPPERDSESRGSALVDAVEWLREELSSGPIAVKELQKRARDAGHCWGGAVRRAKDALRVKPRKNGMDGCWSWFLPDPDTEDAQLP